MPVSRKAPIFQFKPLEAGPDCFIIREPRRFTLRLVGLLTNLRPRKRMARRAYVVSNNRFAESQHHCRLPTAMLRRQLTYHSLLAQPFGHFHTWRRELAGSRTTRRTRRQYSWPSRKPTPRASIHTSACFAANSNCTRPSQVRSTTKTPFALANPSGTRMHASATQPAFGPNALLCGSNDWMDGTIHRHVIGIIKGYPPRQITDRYWGLTVLRVCGLPSGISEGEKKNNMSCDASANSCYWVRNNETGRYENKSVRNF